MNITCLTNKYLFDNWVTIWMPDSISVNIHVPLRKIHNIKNMMYYMSHITWQYYIAKAFIFAIKINLSVMRFYKWIVIWEKSTEIPLSCSIGLISSFSPVKYAFSVVLMRHFLFLSEYKKAKSIWVTDVGDKMCCRLF